MKYHQYKWAVVFTLFFASAGVAWGGEPETHSAYKVTVYNLGAVVDFEGATNVNVRDYEPLIITNSTADVLGDTKVGSFGGTASGDAASGFALSAQFDATQNFALQGAFGMTKNVGLANLTDQKSSWEANFGVIYRLFSNLNYEVHFGYMNTGDLFKERNDYSDVESIIMISNKLTMSF